jgi:hypothetical protein
MCCIFITASGDLLDFAAKVKGERKLETLLNENFELIFKSDGKAINFLVPLS